MSKIPQNILDTIEKEAKHLSPYGTVAQWFLESGFRPGQEMSKLASPPNHNLFGVKARDPQFTKSNQGKTWDWFDTTEYDSQGNKYYVKDKFRIYPSYEASIKDHDAFFVSTPARVERYRKVREATNLEQEIRELGASGYATDPRYETKLWDMINTYKIKNMFDMSKIAKFNKKGVQQMGYIGLDIGHGSNTRETGGGKAVYVGGKWYEEHDFNSKVSVRLKQLLEASGHKVTYGVQQPHSNEVGLSARTSKFNALGVDIVVSVHANWTTSPSVNGIAAFYDEYRDGKPRGASVYRRQQSKKLAQTIMAEYRNQGQIIYTAGMGDGKGAIPSYVGIWTDFHLNRVTTAPSVLMELGFMSGTKDFNKVFGSKQAEYVEQMAIGMANGISKYFGGGEVKNATSTYNPQGLEYVDIPPYTSPDLPYKKLKVGDIVTIRNPFKWYDKKEHKFMISKRHDELVGTKDTIAEVADIPGDKTGYSKTMYLLKKSNSWIFEQDLIEAREDWTKVEVPTEQAPEDGQLPELKEGQFLLEGEIYQVEKLA